MNFVVWCASSACGVSSKHLSYVKHSVVKGVYQFHVYYHMRRIFKRLQVPLLHQASFNAADNPYIKEEFFKICEDYGYFTILSGIGRKNSIGLISVALSGQMATLSRLYDPLDNREIPGFL